MILAIDVGNTNIMLGGMEGKTTVFTSRVRTDRAKTEEEYALLFQNLLALHDVPQRGIEGSILASVVTELRPILARALTILIGTPPLVVGPGIKTGLSIRIDDPAQLGSDLVVGAVAACAKYPKPILLFDLGTATTLSVIDGNGAFLGGMIIPGVRLAVDALSARTSQLPRVDLDEPPARLIGTNTVDCMQSGALYGAAAMLDGVIQRVEEELGRPAGTVVATGGLFRPVAPYCRREIVWDRDLMLEGLQILYEKNRG